MGAARGLTTPLGEQLADIIEPVARSRTTVWEAQSTEEVLRKIKEANVILEKEKVQEIMLGSLDVEALYPSIDQREGPRLVSEEIRKSKLKFENIDYQLAAVYLGSTLTPERLAREGVSNLIPRRKARSNKSRNLL